jgi:hypothetical protein
MTKSKVLGSKFDFFHRRMTKVQSHNAHSALDHLLQDWKLFARRPNGSDNLGELWNPSSLGGSDAAN